MLDVQQLQLISDWSFEFITIFYHNFIYELKQPLIANLKEYIYASGLNLRHIWEVLFEKTSNIACKVVGKIKAHLNSWMNGSLDYV